MSNQVSKGVLPDLSTVTPDRLLSDRGNLLAQEIAANLNTVKEILNKYGIRHKDFRVLYATPEFKAKLAAAKMEWATDQGQRILSAKKAAMAADDSIIDLYHIVKDVTVPPANRIAAHQHLSTLGNIMPARAGSGDEGSSRHSIVINLHPPGSKEVKTINVEGSVVESEDG